MQRFWLIEDSDTGSLSFEEIECEKSFAQTSVWTLVGSKGYFTVFLPFKLSEQKLGHSRSLALRQFYALEKWLSKNVKMRHDYTLGMNDYIIQQHMIKINESLPEKSNEIF